MAITDNKVPVSKGLVSGKITIEDSVITDNGTDVTIAPAGDIFLLPTGSDVVMGTTTAAGNLTAYGTISTIRGGATAEHFLDTYFAGANASSHIYFRRSDSSIVGVKSETDTGDDIGFIHFQGVHTGSAFADSARIYVEQGASSDADRAPGNLFLEASSATGLNAGQLQLRYDGVILTANTLAGTPDEITTSAAGVASSVATMNTEVTTDGNSTTNISTVANGTSGQIKHIGVTVVGNAVDKFEIRPATFVGGTAINFGANPVGKGCTLQYADSEGWMLIGNNGGTVS